MIGRVMTFLGLGPGRDFVLLALPKTASGKIRKKGLGETAARAEA